ncbi:TOBE domain-containing protein [Clostridium luticellarii]|uniref:Molybdenum-pterin-binding protein 2 n=1 Tax=Clostridium luticellarii TaxID=1691940 RepID=A0A2T0BFU2_9CLOT|nr:TOBE domain-containing protein [Clostridium luticellarii]MCI1968505.1 TOBE domain-containing protein [Clostridium luticellarii]MCI1995958.1 TOBE domain-containing protein [Clostridium luticellarii]MCI2040457.1 TOBE domain-containing protein [Clostridium luticellarii]PRR82771.1 Molybdenum-pterin-binding protein 2 [Clostridium luticellarii]
MNVNYRGRRYNNPINYPREMYNRYCPYRYFSKNNYHIIPQSDNYGNSNMTLSALNQFPGVVISVEVTGVVGEVQIDLGCKHLASAIITAASIKNLNLRQGSKVNVVFTATSVMIRKQNGDTEFSARNHFPGVITKITKGDVVGKVVVDIGCGHIVSAIIPTQSINALCIGVGSNVSADIKATEVMIMSQS